MPALAPGARKVVAARSQSSHCMVRPWGHAAIAASGAELESKVLLDNNEIIGTVMTH